MVVRPYCFEPMVKGPMVEESVHCMVSRKERKERGRERVPTSLQVHGPSKLTSSYWAPFLKGSTASWQHHRLETKHLLHGPLGDS